MVGKVIIVTGVSRGIGRSIVEKLMDLDNESVAYGIARSENGLLELKAQYSDRFDYVVGDITDSSKLSLLIDKAIKAHGKIDSVVANAGVIEPVQNVADADVDAWKRLFDINFFSIVSLVKLTIEHLKKTNGNIIFVSSDASDTYFSNWGAYGSSKAALNHFAMTVAEEGETIKCISVAPGIVDTSMQITIREKVGFNMSEEHHQMFKDLHQNNKLVGSDVPATVYAKLAYYGIPKDLNGKYVSYDSPLLLNDFI
ncbi:hypothetical protein KAFR_0C03780 [Kazachstania africana CBS 2517]|uniref:Uncharacterized protein n=1 Tax=Kazachstania africana (strain ATCC 22294 / BCRC 22015 / CBS 2517 / CECT 1963 / NBRC 1671 / NRRL Y-8276) TaxID=1071382 RepID=H2ASL9_KAZAF|nr:hypothetical protein KAFR_0C03780 [Kazachstania africana CBS 2517]CCF57369.1 hypothetical protein KAFR_0C03780 [Kazachstania africana CBS 2517]